MPDILSQHTDAIQIASQLGRLDFISALLAAVALLLATVALLIAIPLFSFLRHRAETVAREEISARMEGLTSKLEAQAVSKMEEMLPILVKEYQDLAISQAAAMQADEVAGAQEDDGHGDNL